MKYTRNMSFSPKIIKISLLLPSIVIVGVIAGDLVLRLDVKAVYILMAIPFFAFVIIKGPEYALAMWTGIIYSAQVKFFPGFNLMVLISIMLFMSVAIYIMNKKSFQIKWDSVQLLHIIFLAYIVLNLYFHTNFSSEHAWGLFSSLFFWWAVPFYCIILYANDLKRLNGFVYAYFFVVLISSSIMLPAFSENIKSLLISESTRLTLSGYDPINFSLSYSIGVLCGMFIYYQTTRRYYQFFSLVSISLFFIFIILSGTRQTILSTILASVLFAYLISKRLSIILPLIVFGLILFLLFSYIQHTALFDRYLILVQDPFASASARGRLFTMGMAIEQILKTPIFGVGAGQYSDVVFGKGVRIIQHVHNLLLSVLVEQGLVGFSIFLSIIVLILKKGLAVLRTVDRHDLRFKLSALFISIFVLNFIRSMFSGAIGDRSLLSLSLGGLWAVYNSRSEQEVNKTMSKLSSHNGN